MVVEDERLVAEDIAECLRSRGYEVCAICNNGADAIAAAHEHAPDLVMMDIVIQGEMDGINTATVLREELDIPVIFLTAYSQDGILERAKTVEPLGFVIKPFEESSLLSTVEMALHKGELDRDLKRSEEWFSTTLNSIGDGVIATDEKGNVKFLNQVAEDLCGWAYTEIAGMPIDDFFRIVNINSREKVDNPALKALETGKIIELEKDTNLIRKDGTEFPIEDSGAAIHNNKGELVGSVLVFRDVSEKKKAEGDVLRYQEHLEELVSQRTSELASRIEMERVVTEISSSLIGLSEQNFDAGVQDALQRVGEMLKLDGCSIYERKIVDGSLRYVPRNFWSGNEEMIEKLAIYPDGVEYAYATWRPVMERDGIIAIHDRETIPEDGIKERAMMERMGLRAIVVLPLSDEFPLKRVVSFLSQSAREWNDEDLVMLRMLARIFQNLMDRHELEERQRQLHEQLSQAQKLEAIGKLTGGIAHDFNNMLVPIMGYADSILSSVDSEMNREDIIEIRKAAESAAALTRQLLAFSRKQILVKKPIDLNALITNMQQLLVRVLGEDICFHLDLEENLPHIEADKSQLEQIVLNLCVNAGDAMPGGGNLKIRTFSGEDEAGRPVSKFQLSDDGCGIEKGQIENIFDPFFTTKGMDGTGLGLSVVLGVVDQHNGELDVQSEPGVGTSFTISIPSSRARSETGPVKPLPRKGVRDGGGRRVLLVEDEPAVLQFVKRALENRGFVIEAAETRSEAIETFDREKGNFDMIFTDAKLPDGTGIEVLEHVMKTHPEIPALISSGYTDDRALVDQARSRGVEFLQKPYALEKLHETVQEVLGEDRQQSGGEVALSG